MCGHRLSTAAKVSSLAKTAMVWPAPVITVQPRCLSSATVPAIRRLLAALVMGDCLLELET